ncbi:MAG TPA: hypothetical protein VFQ21_00720 [Gemmatimonadota bacterium]|nr:hypothetical protein [Gemmatimonadota bacterium]
MRRQISAALLILALHGCDGSPAPEPPPAADTVAQADSTGEERVVVLRGGPLHLEPDEGSPGITEVIAGTLLRALPDSAGVPDWVQVAMWDDRRGWIPVDRLVPVELWAHYGRALGGVSPALLRPAYPVDGGRWAVEAPLGSPGITPASTGWVLSDSTSAMRITAIDSVENICGGELHRFGVLDRRESGERWPLLEAGRIAAPSGTRPVAAAVTVRPLVPDSVLLRLAREGAAELEPAAGAPESTEWVALGPDAAWAALSWPDEDDAQGISQRAVALVFRRSPAGWERVSAIAPVASTAGIPTAAWRPVAAYSTGGASHPTLLLLEVREYEGAHLDIWIERGDGYQRIYEGYYWGC